MTSAVTHVGVRPVTIQPFLIGFPNDWVATYRWVAQDFNWIAKYICNIFDCFHLQYIFCPHGGVAVSTNRHSGLQLPSQIQPKSRRAHILAVSVTCPWLLLSPEMSLVFTVTERSEIVIKEKTKKRIC